MKNIRSKAIVTVLKDNGELHGYELSYPLCKNMVDELHRHVASSMHRTRIHTSFDKKGRRITRYHYQSPVFEDVKNHLTFLMRLKTIIMRKKLEAREHQLQMSMIW